MIIHSPIISGSLTFAEGATFTLPDNGVYSGSFSGSVQVHQIKSDLIPDLNNTYDLGSPSYQFKDLYLSSASLYIDGTQVISTANGDLTITTDANQSLRLIEEGADTITLQTQNGDITLTATGTGNIELDAPVQIQAGNKILSSDGNAIVFGDDISVEGNISVTGTVDGIDLLAFSGSVASTFAGLSTDYNDLQNVPAGIVSGSSQVTPLLPAGTVSGSSQVNADNVINFDSNVKEKLDADGVISGSSQVNADTITNFDSNVKAKLNTDGVISGSSQVNLASVTGNNTSNVSEGTNLYYTDARVKTKLDSEGVVSGSSQISLSGFSTTDLSEGTNLYYTDARVKTKLNAEGVFSSSAQITITESQISDLDHYNDTDFDNRLATKTTTNLSEGTNLYYTDARVKTKLNAEAVVSGSSQILTLVSIDEDNMVSNSDTKLPTQQSVKAYVDNEITSLISGSPATLDTLNELAQALGDDPNFATTISNTIGGKVSQSLQIISGNGLTGGGNLTTDRTLNVVGTANRISVSADAVDIASTYVGQTSITTLGTIGTGTWQGTAIADGYISSATAWNAKLDSAGTISTNDYAKFDASGDLTGRSYTEVKTDLSLNNVENTAVSTWAGSSNITTLGTISSGTWNGSVIASAYLDADTAHLSTTQTFSGAKTFSAAVNISNATASTTKTTGALIVTGGVGVSGALNVGGDVVAYASSDERLKDNIELISNPIEKVQSLKGVTWSWNENADELQKSLPNVGVIAQDVEKVLPQLVHDRDNGFKGVDYAKLTGLLIEAIKEQQKQIDELKSKLG